MLTKYLRLDCCTWFTSNWCNCPTTTTTTKHMPKDLSIHAPPITREDTEQMGDVRNNLEYYLIIEIHCFHLFLSSENIEINCRYNVDEYLISVIFISINSTLFH